MEVAFDNELTRDLVVTLVFMVVVPVVRTVLLRLVRAGAEVLNEQQRRWSVGIRNGSWAVLVVGLFFIWAPQLHTLALSITAFAVAVVIATREVIACLVGGLARAGTQPFKVGDWVTIENVSGEVVDVDAMGVLLEEVDLAGRTYQYTGRSHLVPNVKLLTCTVSKSSYLKNFVMHDVPVIVQHPLHKALDPEALMTRFEKIAEKYFAPHRDQAVAVLKTLRRKMHVDIPGAEPQLFLSTTEHSHYVYTARLFLPTAEAANIASDITREFVGVVNQGREPAGNGT